jgi:hypothetical protein
MSAVFYDLGYTNPEVERNSDLPLAEKMTVDMNAPPKEHREPRFRPLTPEEVSVGIAGVYACRKALYGLNSSERYPAGWTELPDGTTVNLNAGWAERYGEIIPVPPEYDQ